MDAITSSDGREIITYDQLEEDILHEIITKGRVNLISLPTELNVDISHIEFIIDKRIINKKGFHVMQNEIISYKYLEGIGDEVNELLQSRGILAMTEIAHRYSLPLPLIQSVMPSYIGSRIEGYLYGQHICTSPYKNRITSIIKGAILGVTQPTLVKSITSHAQGMIEPLFLKAFFNEIIDKQIVPGQIEANKSGQDVFVPEHYIHLRKEWVIDMFHKNGYISYNQATDIGIANSRSYLRSILEGIQLKAHYVSHSYINNVRYNAEIVLENNGALSIPDLIGDIFSLDDIPTITRELLKGIDLKYHALDDYHIVLNDTIDRCYVLFKQHFKNQNVNTDHSQWANHIKEWFPKIQNNDLIMALITHIEPTIKEIRQTALANPTPLNHLIENSEHQASFQTKFDSLYYNLIYFHDNINQLEDPPLEKKLRNYLLNTLCKDLLQAIIKDLSNTYFLKETDTVDSLPSLYSDDLNRATQILSSQKGDVLAFIEVIKKVSTQMGVTTKGIDDKMKAEIYLTHITNSRAQVQVEKDILKLYQLSISMIYSKCTGRIILLSSKVLKDFVQYLKKVNDREIIQDSYKQLVSYIKAKKANDSVEKEKKEKEVKEAINQLLKLSM